MDLISREDTLKEIEEWNIASFYELNEHSNEAYHEIKEAVKHMPTITDVVSKAEVLETYAELYDLTEQYPSFREYIDIVYDKLNSL